MTKDLSNCCQAPVVATHGCDDDFLHGGKKCSCEIVTSWYECEKCKQPCDVQITIQNYTKAPEPTQKLGWKEEYRGIVYTPGSIIEPGVDYVTIKVSDLEEAEKEAYERGRLAALKEFNR